LLFVTFSGKGVIQRLKLQAVKKDWEQKVRAVEEEQLQLRELSKKLDEESVEKDTSARELIEKIAREEHGMIRPGETVYRVKRGK
jgi:cell division protein FtsB